MGIKILLDDNVLQTQEEVEKYVKEIGVKQNFYKDALSYETIILLFEERRLEKCYLLLQQSIRSRRAPREVFVQKMSFLYTA